VTGEVGAPSWYTVYTGCVRVAGSTVGYGVTMFSVSRRTDANIAVTCGTVVPEAGDEELLQAPFRATERA